MNEQHPGKSMYQQRSICIDKNLITKARKPAYEGRIFFGTKINSHAQRKESRLMKSILNSFMNNRIMFLVSSFDADLKCSYLTFLFNIFFFGVIKSYA